MHLFSLSFSDIDRKVRNSVNQIAGDAHEYRSLVAILKAMGIIPKELPSPTRLRGMKRRSISPTSAIKNEDADSDIEIVEVSTYILLYNLGCDIKNQVSMKSETRTTLTVQTKVVSHSIKKNAGFEATSASLSKANGTVPSMGSTMAKIKKETDTMSVTRKVKTEVHTHRTKRIKTARVSSCDVIDLT